ncbi:MAG: PQQ-binding-like beta-propeller repeat protein [Verrucomicrobiales bacterium]|nr:PQQ-binding-like beta-propeller repeat protein [Verrucomicrobiales bacterium]
MRTILTLYLLSQLSAFAAPPAWNQFRGPNGSGVLPDAQPPIIVSTETLAWKTEVPFGHSSPVLAGHLVVLTAIEDERFLTLAFDRATGQQVWSREAPQVPFENVHQTSSPAAPSVLTDADRIIVYFGSFGLICYDHDGKELWNKKLPTPKSLYGTSTSPISHGKNLYLVIDNQENLPDSKLSKSKLYAIHRGTGETVWETGRPFNRSGWSTPTVWQHSKGTELVVLGSSRASGYNIETGEELWFTGGFSRETIARPVVNGDHVYIAAAMLGGVADESPDPKPFWTAVMSFDKNNDQKLEPSEMNEHFTFPLRPELPPGHAGYGIPLPRDPNKRAERQKGIFGWVDKDRDGFWTREEFLGHMKFDRGKPKLVAVTPGGTGDVSETNIAWELNRSLPEIPSPIYVDGRIYMVRNGGLLSAVDANDGGLIYRERLGASGHYSASPVAAGGHLYLLSSRGTLSVAKPGDTFEVIHQHDLGEPAFVTPAIDHNTLYIRTKTALQAHRKSP